MSTEKNNSADIRWIIGGAVALVIAGTTLVTLLALYSDRDQTATIASIGTLITATVAAIFGAAKMNEGVSRKIDENTKITEHVASGQYQLQRRLNGELDQRIADASRQAVVNAMPEIRKTMEEVLDQWTAPVRN